MKGKDLKLPLKGSCHCGVIKFLVNISLKDLRRCNCSICSRKGFVMGSALLMCLQSSLVKNIYQLTNGIPM